MSHHLWILLTCGTVAAACALMGCFLLLRKLAMLGDAIGHAVLFGIAASFCLSGSRSTPLLLCGATLCGWFTGFFVEYLRQRGVQNDAAISVTFTTLFALGILLISLYGSHIDLDVDCVLFGEPAYIHLDLWQIGPWNIPRSFVIMSSVLLLSVLLIVFFYRPLKVSTFDPLLAAALGLPIALIQHMMIGFVSLTVVASFESVGVVLVIAMLITPAATAYLWTSRLSAMLLLSMGFGISSTALGYGLAQVWDTSIAGAMALAMGGFFILTLFLSPQQGLLVRWRAARRRAGLT